MREKQKRKTGFFSNHAKSSAAMVSIILHAVLVVVALSFVAVTVIQKDDLQFKAKPVQRPRMQLKKLQVPVNLKKTKKPAPRLRKRIVVKNAQRQTPDIKLPEITGVSGGIGNAGGLGDGIAAIGFTMPEMNFFGAKAKGEKIVFVVHFGPATISGSGEDNRGDPFSRMTGLTIRNRLTDLVDTLPKYTLFNVICYYAGDAWAMEPKMQLATEENKQKVKDWMAPVNPLEGDYDHCFSKKPRSVGKAASNYPTRVDNLPFYAPKWVYPYVVPKALEEKYAPGAKNGIMHWGRGVAWAIMEQKADTIFVLTTNYIDGWHVAAPKDKGKNQQGNQNQPISPDQPVKMAKGLQAMCRDTYGPDRRTWPTINVVVLAKAGRDATGASRVLGEEFGPIIRAFDADGSIIDDIRDYMNKDELQLYRKYQSMYGNK